MSRIPKGTRLRTFEELVLVETDECVLWPHPPGKNGYGQVKFPGGKFRYIHQLALERRVGPRPGVLFACHAPMPGGHPRHCMNYRHLRWDTQRGNAADSLADGTIMRGSRHYLTKLTDDDVRLIRSLRGVESQTALAAKFDVHQTTISRVQNADATRPTWKHLS